MKLTLLNLILFIALLTVAIIVFIVANKRLLKRKKQKLENQRYRHFKE